MDPIHIAMATKRSSAKKSMKAVPKKKAALKKVAKKKATTKRSVARKPAPARRTVRTQEWPVALPGNAVHVDVGAEQERPMQKPPARPSARSFLRQVQTPKPNEQHPGQTAEHGASNDRPGSQPERVRHLYPNGNIPKSGSARSTQYKGKRRGNGPAGASE